MATNEGIIHTPNAALPQPFGLYSVTTPEVTPDPDRIAFGMRIRNINCGMSGTWPIDCDADIAALVKTGARAPDSVWTGEVNYVDDNCGGLFALESEQRAVAEALLNLREPIHVEKRFAAELALRLAANDLPLNVPVASTGGIVGALGVLERMMGDYGFNGVIHAARHHHAAARNAQLVDKQGTTLYTGLNNKWAFGGGYQSLANVIYATGPVVIKRGTVATTAGPDYRHNRRDVVAERSVIAGWECYTLAVLVAP